MDNKLKRLINKNKETRPELMTDLYSGQVNNGINKKFKFGEEHAIMRKTLSLVISELEKLGIDPSLFKEFKEYNNYVESLKIETKKELEV